MELHRLRYFVAVAELGSFTRAAAREGVTQPSLSQQILELEKELDTSLFDRLGRKVVLTAAGEQLLPFARSVLTAVADAERAVRGGVGGELRAGAIPTIAPYLLPGVTRKFLETQPGSRLRLLEDRTERLLEALRAGELDVGVMALPVSDEKLHVEKLFTEPLLVAVPAGHRLATKEVVRFGDLSDEPFLLLDDLHCFGDQVLSLCRRGARFEPRVACKGEQIGTLLALVSGGVGVTVVPRMAATAEPSKSREYRPLAAPGPTRTLCAVWHKHRYRPPAVRAFLDLLRASD
ncbi:MAG TPA: hydrogen peroxide-inducible genes activator [Gemmataceae bacterium]|jgi:LysR family hydrogen peroxide-inducible transcriptional activator|nr:hydrogen peroxide-inducible genes activator [Gemmataceae bacterium]